MAPTKINPNLAYKIPDFAGVFNGKLSASLSIITKTERQCQFMTVQGITMSESKPQLVVLIPGDGIGPEVTAATVRVLEAAGFQAEWESYAAGAEALSRYGTPLPDELLEAIQRTKVALKGPVTTPVGEGFTSVNVSLRKALDLYANQRPVRNLPGVPSRFENVDLVVVRENTEDLYSGLEHVVVPGVVESLKIITEKASTRIARNAFEYAKRYGRKKVTAVHKANIMKLSDGLFLNCFRKVAREHPEIESDDYIVDNACMQLVLNPLQFDVLLMENLYGDILSDLAAGLVGGIGVVPGANIGEGCAVFETVHGSAPQLAGRNQANPTAMIQTAVLMLRHLGEDEIAERVYKALVETLQSGIKTPDIGGTASTTAFTEAIVQRIETDASKHRK
jgi:isocitrate dehydrogenase (NAD+)